MTSTDVTRLAIAVASNEELIQIAAEAMRINFYNSRVALRETVNLLDKLSEIEYCWWELACEEREFLAFLEKHKDDDDWYELDFLDVWEGYFNQRKREEVLIRLAEEAKYKGIKFSSLERFFREYHLTNKEKLLFLEYYFLPIFSLVVYVVITLVLLEKVVRIYPREQISRCYTA